MKKLLLAAAIFVGTKALAQEQLNIDTYLHVVRCEVANPKNCQQNSIKNSGPIVFEPSKKAESDGFADHILTVDDIAFRGLFLIRKHEATKYSVTVFMASQKIANSDLQEVATYYVTSPSQIVLQHWRGAKIQTTDFIYHPVFANSPIRNLGK